MHIIISFKIMCVFFCLSSRFGAYDFNFENGLFDNKLDLIGTLKFIELEKLNVS